MPNPKSTQKCQVVYSKSRFGSTNRSDYMPHQEAVELSGVLRAKGWTSVRVDCKTVKEQPHA